ncbi:glycoside hydrolase family 130 protein [Pontiella sulfatireligans]|uniref:1,4-beta-mannosyl-N-acetylglucosamine phosphorylase n=1 Tax=Pontiella sulfatireligans TaxID=2750658 RepID=A0A6C2UFE7_9BACT|nr:glycoside hydrolase family 130 protein [Pontiella sulfatireligans]VGO18649.1 1,4-beta-mannosyl-N-acetylglucosamine phosphorylase [Pontiella sulfatireligans]
MDFHGFRKIEPLGELKTAPFVEKYAGNPVLSGKDIPYSAALVFNCSVWKEDDTYTMVFRNDYFYSGELVEQHPDDTNFGIAHSDDGINWEVAPEPIFEYKTEDVGRVYDPRVIKIEGRYYLTCCASTTGTTEDRAPHGPRAAIFVTDDFKNFELVDMSLPCSRNSLLFPEKINGKYYRLERPFWGDCIDSFSNETDHWIGQPFNTWVTSSPDLVHWGQAQPLIMVDDMPYANIKNGPGAPPIKTDKGWLLLIHGVDYDPARGKNGWEDKWKHRYHAGVALLDLEDPTKLIGLGQAPLICPDLPYETDGGFRNNVVFPMAGIVEDDGMVKIYYGAADAHICLATAKLDDLLAACDPV